MTVIDQINQYIWSHPEAKRKDLQALHDIITNIMPAGKLWFLDGKNTEGKVVSNPNIGFGVQMMKYADGSTKEFYQIGLSANTTGISVYIMGIKDRKYLSQNFAPTLGKASITGYCIKFKSLKDIKTEILEAAIQAGVEGGH